MLLGTTCAPPGDPGATRRALLAPGLRVNELLLAGDPIASGDRGHAWIELLNQGAPLDVDGARLVDVDGASEIVLPPLTLPAGAYLVVHLDRGEDDLDASDGVASIHVGDGALAPSLAAGGIGLYAPGAGSIQDFVAWSLASTVEGPVLDDAVAAGIWTDGEVVPLAVEGRPPEVIGPGESIGRDVDGTDTDSPDDWRLAGGSDAGAPTPGAENRQVLEIELQDGDGVEPATAEWLVMIYVALDTNLIPYGAWSALNSVEQALADLALVGRVRVVVHLDTAYDHFHEVDAAGNDLGVPPGSAWAGELRGDTDPSVLRIHALADQEAETARLPEPNTGDPATLRDFVSWSTFALPSERRALVISGHGSGWGGTANDGQNESGAIPDALQIGELGGALDGLGLDLIVLDACNMATIEVAHQLRGAADVLVAHEGETSNEPGLPYHLGVFLPMVDGATAEELGAEIVVAYHADKQWRLDATIAAGPPLSEMVSDLGLTAWTASAIRLGGYLDAITWDVNELALALGAARPTRSPAPVGGLDDHGYLYAATGDPADNVQIGVRVVTEGAQHFTFPSPNSWPDEHTPDLYHWAERLLAEPRVPDAYKEAAAWIVRDVDAAVIAERHGPAYPDAHGLAVYFPLQQTKILPRPPLLSFSYDWPTTQTGAPYPSPWSGTPSGFFRQSDGASPLVKYGPDMDPFECLLERPDHPNPNAPAFAFAAETHWNELLQRYYEPVADVTCVPSVVPAGSPVTCVATGSSDSDGAVTSYYWDLDPSVSTDRGDWDKDCKDELDDDNQLAGPAITITLPPGLHEITLTVWDDQHTIDPGHWETDQDSTSVLVIDCGTPGERH